MSTLILEEVDEDALSVKEVDEEEERLEDLDLYKLDYERTPDGAETLSNQEDLSNQSQQPHNQVIAAGGEILQPGDHVYMWCTLYQHHGIVLRNWNNDDNVDDDDDNCLEKDNPSVLIAEFTNVQLAGSESMFVSASTASGAVSGAGTTGGFRFVHEREPSKWHRVKYKANAMECMTWRPGTCSAAIPLDPIQTLMRVQFLHDCRHLLPEYHLMASNCETVAVWCVTGKWETLQYQQTMKWSQVGALTTAGLIPGIGMAAAGLAFWHSISTRQKWEETANRLNDEFQWYALGKRPDLNFAQFQS